MTFNNLEEIKAANKASGQNWFSSDTIKWFNSIIEPGLYDGRFFVTSERDKTGSAWNGQRRWTVRRANDDGTIDTMGEFGQFASKARAVQRAQSLTWVERTGGDVDETADRLADNEKEV